MVSEPEMEAWSAVSELEKTELEMEAWSVV